MSDCMIIRRGGGANIDAGGAVLICETKAENSASISKSGKTVKLTPDKAFHGDDASKAEYIFSISKSDLGAWTLAVSKDEDSNSKEVTLAAGDLRIEKLNINNGAVLSPETGLAEGLDIVSGTYNSANKTISFAYTGYELSGIGIRNFDATDFTKVTFTFSEVISTVTCAIRRGNKVWGSKTASASSVVVNKNEDFSADEGIWAILITVPTNRIAATVTSIIFE